MTDLKLRLDSAPKAVRQWLLSLGLPLGLCLAAQLLAAVAAAGETLRPPSTPLITHDPYFSIWSPGDRLSDVDTVHWTGRSQRLISLIRIDGKVFRLMGKEPGSAPPLPQVDQTVTATRTTYTFEGAGTQVKVFFLTPALPDDLEVLSRPVTYLHWEVQSLDGKQHEAQVYFEAAAELAVNEPGQKVTWTQVEAAGLQVRSVGSSEQPILRKKGDDLRIDWGQLLLAAPAQPQTAVRLAVGVSARSNFAAKGGLGAEDSAALAPCEAAAAPGLVAAFDLGLVGGIPRGRWLMLAYDDEFSIKYFGRNLRPYWRRDGSDAAALLRRSATDYLSLQERCTRFDQDLAADLRKVGGEKYAQLCVLAYRQTFAGNKICADANGQPLMFPKENFSNGCIGTVDVLFPQAPFFLALSPALTKAMLVPVLDYAASPRWRYGYAPHDLGTYPHATGQVYGMDGKDGDRMPVEESGNMLVMLAALAKFEGSSALANEHWPMLARWADYLVREGLDPQNQLCSADMFGHLPRNANLALKAIIGIGAFSQLCEKTGRGAEGARYAAIARDYAARWQELAKGEGRTLLAYGQPGTWSMKHNLIWDSVLGLNLFPAAVGEAEIAWYLKVQRKYGLPVDNRTETCLIDWALWSMAPARKDGDFQALLEPIWRYVHETPQRVPLGDWFDATSAAHKGMQARPVVGGLFIKMLANGETWTKWAGRGANRNGPWAPLELEPPTHELAATAQNARVKWRYTLEPPGGDWMQPGFDDHQWKEGEGGFGVKGTPGAIVGSEWQTPRIWLRREFDLPDRRLNRLQLKLIYDEDPEVYLNGVLAARLSGWSGSYLQTEIAPAALAVLKPGKNILAVQASQTFGGQVIDVGLTEDIVLPSLRKLLDQPMRDPFVCLGPDGTYYLTGTTGSRTGGAEMKDGWWYVNEGIRIWKSTDLTNWVAMGLVWSFERDATWQKPIEAGRRALWAPEIHYLKGSFWLTYCLNWKKGGTGLLKSTSGKPEGPYVDVQPQGPLTDEIDASLFEDDDGKVYFVFQNGKITRLKDDLSGLAESPRLLKPANAPQVGFEGAFLKKMQGRYYLICAEFNRRDGVSAYDCMVASAGALYGPYGDRYLALPSAGHNMFFRDKLGQWWSTYFGNDPQAAWLERPGILPIRQDAGGFITSQPSSPQQ